MPGSLFSKQGPKAGAQPGSGSQQQSTSPTKKAAVDRNQAQVGAVLRSQAPETIEDREKYLRGAWRTVVEPLVDDAKQRLTDSLSAKMNKILAAEKQRILADARNAVNVEVMKSGRADERGDIKADALITDSHAWDETASVAVDQATDLVKKQDGALKAAVDPAFTVKPDFNLKVTARAAHLDAVKVEAKRLIDAKVKLVEVQLTAEVNKSQTKNSIVHAATQGVSAKSTEGVQKEVDARHAANDDVHEAADKPVKAAADEIRTNTKAYLEKGLGANGTGWFRSTQFKNFHKKMKENARALGHAETDSAIQNKRAGAPDGRKAEFEYQAMQAHTLTHKAAKMDLREVMREFADELLGDTGKKVDLDALLSAPATAAAWATLRKTPANKPAAAKAAVAAVKAAKPAALTAFHTQAQTLKNEYVKAADSPDAEAQQKKYNEVTTTKINPAIGAKDDQGQSKFGHKMLKQAMEAPTASKGLQRVAALIDATTPQVGDSTELEIELKIPASHGAFVYFTVTGSAERSAHMELGIDIAFGAGWETWGLSARGGFKVFLKAAAADTVNAMQLIHYGAFRNLTHVSNRAANFWAGVTDPGKTGVGTKQFGKNEQAELWAAMTEERAFGKDENAYVEVGGGIAGGATLKAGIEGEVSGELTSARRWDAEVFAEVAKTKKAGQNAGHDAGKIGGRDAGGTTGERDKAALEKRQAVIDNAKRVNRFQFGTSITAEANGQKFSISLEATYTGGEGWEITATGAIPYDPSQAGSSTLVSKIAGSYVPAALSGVKKIVDAYKAKENKSGNGKAQVGGAVADAGEDVMIGLDAGGMTGDLLKKLSAANPQNMEAEHADGINDTARLWLGKDVGLKGAMGEHGDMSQATSEVEAPQPFGATSQLEISLLLERPDRKKDEHGTLQKREPTKWAFKVSRSKELKAGADLGAGLGLTGKLTRKQEIGGVAGKGLSLQGLKGARVFGGGSEAWVATSLGGGTTGGGQGGQGGHGGGHP